MTNREDLPDTVAVPVELLKELIEIVSFHKGSTPAGRQATALLPKPKPRLVGVSRVEVADLGRYGQSEREAWFDEQPDLLTLLDDVLLETVSSLTARLTLRVRIRAALGVTE